MSKVWMITGASRGLGLEIAKTVLAAGERVVATARKVEALGVLGKSERLLVLPLDVTEAGAAEVAVKAAEERFGQVNVLVNNAGYGHFGPFEEATAEDVEQQYRVNVFGAMNAARAVLPGMRERREGRIFNISSIAGLKGGPMASLYCSSKFALEGWSESLAVEMAAFGVQVTLIEPGFFRTDFLEANSAQYTPVKHEEYREGLEQMKAWLDGKSHQQEGDPESWRRCCWIWRRRMFSRCGC